MSSTFRRRAPSPSTRHNPRILCLHGGGVTAEIFTLQARFLINGLTAFRLVFVDGPFPCGPGPGMLPVFEDMGPYRRWLRWRRSDDDGGGQAEISDEAAARAIEESMETAMRKDDADGANGEWVGLLGFSQGAKVAGSVLYESQIRGSGAVGMAGGKWRFAVIMNGRAPLVSLSERSRGSKAFVPAGAVTEVGMEFEAQENRDRLSLPTVHVHGLRDPGLELHRRLVRDYMEEGSAEVVEWDGEHRLPLKKEDNVRVFDAIMRVARKAGVYLPNALNGEA